MIYLFSSSLGDISYDWDGSQCHRLKLQPGAQALQQHNDPVAIYLNDYFRGAPTNLPALKHAATPFQHSMRQALLNIPVGEVRTYGELAKTLNTSARGLGQALKANALPILIPCHRIVAANGLGGFAGGATWKQRLLHREGFLINPHIDAETAQKQSR
ncbi:MAG: methylated-DNA--[protein]-cysteine S-methyltransferase [Mariprofundus sp.]|nr:methylated-DNA--[protein]-cysteine S-methyltransferase [Mariprofundus sp.]